MTDVQKQRKRMVSLRIDEDTIAWFKADGPGHQTRMNDALRQHIERDNAEADTPHPLRGY